MINTAYATLGQTPKTLDGVGMHPAVGVDLISVVDRFVPHAEPVNRVIDMVFVCVDDGSLGYIPSDKRHDRRPLDIGDNLGDYPAPPLGDADYGGLVFCTTPTLAVSLPADIGFVNLNLIVQNYRGFIKKFADLLEYSPCRLVSYLMLSLKSLSRKASPCCGYFMYGVKPYLKGCGRLMEDCASKWRYVMPALVTSIDISALILVMLGDFLANRTLNAVRVALAYQPFKAGVVVWKHPLKVFGCELPFSHRNHPLSEYIIAQKVLHVKG